LSVTGGEMGKNKELSYSGAIAELEKIVESIESEDIDVDVLAEKMKRAAALIKFCKDRLKSTEEEVKKIIADME
jgi:exodeoxyribonuclease VII small subunit